MRIIKIVVILLVILAFALLAVRFVFLDKIVHYSLQKTGAEEVSIHISEMNWERTKIDTFSATYLLANGDKYFVKSRDLSFHYSVSEILETRKISRVTIGGITVRRLQTTLKPGTDFTFPKQVELLKDELRGKIPLETFSITNLKLQGDLPLLLIDKDIQLQASFENKAIQAEINMDPASDTQLNIDIQSSDSFHGAVNLVLLKQDTEVLAVNILLQPESLAGKIVSQIEPMRDVLLQTALLADFPESSGSILVDFDIPLSSTMEKSFSVKATVSDPVFPVLTAASVQLQLFGRLSDNELLLGEESNFQADNLLLGKTGFEKLFVELQGSFSKQKDQLLFELAKQQNFQVTGFSTEKAQISELNVHLDRPVQLFSHKKTLSVNSDGLRIDPLQIQEGERLYEIGELYFSDFKINNSVAGLELFAHYSSPAVVVNANGQQLPLKELSGTVQLNNNSLTVELQFAPEELPARMQVDLSHDLITGSGSAKIKTDRRINVDGDGDSLANLITFWPYPFNLDGGKIAFKADGSWKPKEKLKVSAFVSVTGGQGFYKQFLFNGLDVRQDLAVLPELYSKSSGSFSLKQLIGGLDAYDIKTDVNLLAVESGPLPLIQITDFSASLFDGTVSSKEVNYDLNMPDSRFFVDVEAMDLDKLVSIIKMDALYVTGEISGSIPVKIKGKEISVESGHLHSNNPGGEIRYTPGDMNQAGLTAYALKAVEELQYQILQVTANYLPSGQLDLDIGLKGISPALDTRRPVHLNIHAEQNLPALMQSLRFSKGLTEELDKRIKQHYN